MTALTLQSAGLHVIALAIASARVAGFFVFVPLLPQSAPSRLIKSGMVVGLASMVLPLAYPMAEASGQKTYALVFMLIGEFAFGAMLGLAARVPMWVAEAYGAVVDNLRGGFSSSQVDRGRGSESSAIGDLLAQAGFVVFLQSGALLVCLGMLFASFRAWPIGEIEQALGAERLLALAGLLKHVMAIAVLFSLPYLLMCVFVDLSFGFVSLAVPQVETYFLSMPAKFLLALLSLYWLFTPQAELLMQWHQDLLRGVFPELIPASR